MTTKDLTRMIGIDAPPKINDEFVRYGENGTDQIISIERIRSYFYKVSYNDLPQDKNIDFQPSGACSAYVANGKLYRTFDWKYDNLATFRIQCKGFKGTSILNGLTDGNLNENLITQLPFHMVDGRNDSGIMVSTHVLFNDWGWHGNGSTPLTKLPFIILSQIESLTDFQTQIADILADIGTTASLDRAEYLLQFLVTDGITSYAILPPTTANGSYSAVNISSNPKLTNFRWVSDSTVQREDLQTRPTGVERFNLMPCDMKELRFTKAYESADRLSEFIGIDGTTKDSTDAELTVIYNKAHEAYLERERNGVLWQTVHAVTYSEKGIEDFFVQENFEENFGNNNGSDSTLIINVAFQKTVSGYELPDISVDDVQKITTAIREGKSIAIRDLTGNVTYVPTMCDFSETYPSFTMLYYWLAVVDYQITNDGSSVEITVHKFE